jgi:thioredoxin-dependent peroxiredoxin
MIKLRVGEKAPQFTAKNQLGNSISLKELLGSRVILYFYPKDNTPGCTTEACNLRDHYKVLQNKGYVVLGVSTDNEKSHQGFINKYSLPFDLLADIDKSIVTAYGVFGEKKMYGKTVLGIQRSTFIIDENGYIECVIDKVDTKNHAAQILENC